MVEKPRLFLYERCRPRVSDTLLVKLLLSESPEEGGLFQKIESKPFKGLVYWTKTPQEAEYVVLPMNYSNSIKYDDYIKGYIDFAQKNKLKMLIINHGDYSKPINIPNSLVLRTSAYKSKLLANEIIIPAFVEDLGLKYGFEYREKNQKELPSIGFSGMVRLPSLYQELKYYPRLLKQWVEIHFMGASYASYQGLYYRRKAVESIQKSPKCEANFKIRNSFSRNLKTIGGKPEDFRREFVDSIKNSDFSLVVRGDGNFSLRFYEVLSLGRIPIFVDTDMSLPLEDEIDYDSFMIRVKYDEVCLIPEIVQKFWNKLSNDSFIEMQKKARQAFGDRLAAGHFYEDLFFSKV